MNQLFATIVLQDISSQSIQIDTLMHPIQGTCWGFRQVPPGFHYIALPSQGHRPEFWCYLQPGEILVKRFDAALQQFVDDPEMATQHYIVLANNGMLEPVLLPYTISQWPDWHTLTQYIKTSSPSLQQESSRHDELVQALLQSPENGNTEARNLTRFRQAFLGTHQGNIDSFLAEFQFAFLRCLISFRTQIDEVAWDRWIHLLDAMYNAGEDDMAAYPPLFSQFVDVLLPQFAQLSPEMFDPQGLIGAHLRYLIQDMMDTDNGELQQKAEELATYVGKKLQAYVEEQRSNIR